MKGKAHKGPRAAVILGLMAILIVVSPVRAAQERGVATTSREIVVERLSRLEERVIRLEEGQKRLEQRIDKLEAALNQRIDDLRQILLWGFGMNFTGMFALIGFVIWDRRTALTPAVRRIEGLQERQQKIEEALRQLSKENPKLAESLRNLGLL